MIYIAIMSGSAAIIHYSMMLISLAFARAPGWQSYRIFALIAFLMGLYATNNALVLHGDAVTSFTAPSAQVNVAIGAFVPSLWIAFGRVRDNESFSRLDKLLLAALLPLGLFALIPGLVVKSTHLTSVESLGLSYRTPDVSFLGNILYGASLLTMIIMTSRYVRKARGGTIGAKVSAF